MYVYGKNVVKEALHTKKNIRRAFVAKNNKDQELINEIKNNKIKIQFVDKLKLDRLVEGVHQGFILEIDEVETYPLESILNNGNPKSLVVILDHLEDPHNFGAIIRTSVALGIDAIIIPNDRSVGITGTVVKTSAGSINYIKIIRTPNLNNAIEKLKKNGYWIVGTDMDGTDYTEIDYNCKIALIIGNEGKGISNILKNNCDYIAKIPMTNTINSLNASVSCGIILSEIVRQRRQQ